MESLFSNLLHPKNKWRGWHDWRSNIHLFVTFTNSEPCLDVDEDYGLQSFHKLFSPCLYPRLSILQSSLDSQTSSLALLSKRIYGIEPRIGRHTCFFTGSRLGIIEALDLVNYWKCWVRQHPDSNPDKTQKMWQLNPRFPLPLNYSPSRKGRGIFRCFVRKILAYQLSAYKFYMDQNSQMRLF